MNPKMKAIIESYVRAFIVALGVAYSDGFTGIEELLIAAAIAVVGPAIRSINKNDPSFGVVADTVENAIITAASKSKKKTK